MPVPFDSSTITHGIQLAVAPVFLLTAVSGMIGAVAGRLARIIDRARRVEDDARASADDALLQRSYIAGRAAPARAAGQRLHCAADHLRFFNWLDDNFSFFGRDHRISNPALGSGQFFGRRGVLFAGTAVLFSRDYHCYAFA
jgi:Protein of unknown function (DUF2721)